jgi:uncharacterized membrane protein YfcA
VSNDDLLLLSLVLGAGAFVEAVAGFGGTVLALSLGARWFGIEELLAWFLPLNLGLSLTLALRGRRVIAWRALGTAILPMILVGLAGGTALAWVIAADGARAVFAGLVIVVAGLEIVAQVRARHGATLTTGMPVMAQRGLLLGAGVVHGLFATGGPLAVAVIARMLPAKTTLRSTLAVMWFVLNVIVLTRLAVRGHVDATSLGGSLRLVPAMAIGMLLGELVHVRVSERAFRAAVAGLLLVTGALLLHASLTR